MADSKSKVVVVTGASAGVGRATVRKYAEAGASVGLLARGEGRLEETRSEVERLGGKALAIPTDVADADAVERAAEKVESTFGPIDLWINNAMVTVISPLAELTPEEFRRVTDVTYLGTVHGTMAALKRMRKRDKGVILQVGSALAYRAIPLQSAYCGAKHAIQGFSESLRSELIHEKSSIEVIMVQMPALNTPQFDWCRTKMPYKCQPVPPIYQPEVAAEAIVWAASHGPRELNVGGNTSVILALNKFFPGIGDRYLGMTGFDDQQTDTPEEPGRPDNLFTPVEGDWAAQGRFSDQAKEHSNSLWASTHKGAVAAAGVLVAGMAYYGLKNGSQTKSSAAQSAN